MDNTDSPIVNFAQLATDSKRKRRVEEKKDHFRLASYAGKEREREKKRKKKAQRPRRVFRPSEKREEELKQKIICGTPGTEPRTAPLTSP